MAKLQLAAANAAAAWRMKRPLLTALSHGLASAPPTPLQNRGSYEMAVELGG